MNFLSLGQFHYYFKRLIFDCNIFCVYLSFGLSSLHKLNSEIASMADLLLPILFSSSNLIFFIEVCFKNNFTRNDFIFVVAVQFIRNFGRLMFIKGFYRKGRPLYVFTRFGIQLKFSGLDWFL